VSAGLRLKWSVRVAKTALALWPVQLRLGVRRLMDELGGVTFLRCAFWVDPIFQNAFEKNAASETRVGAVSASAGVPLGAR
jgi:hypothetical protein